VARPRRPEPRHRDRSFLARLGVLCRLDVLLDRGPAAMMTPAELATHLEQAGTNSSDIDWLRKLCRLAANTLRILIDENKQLREHHPESKT